MPEAVVPEAPEPEVPVLEPLPETAPRAAGFVAAVGSDGELGFCARCAARSSICRRWDSVRYFTLIRWIVVLWRQSLIKASFFAEKPEKCRWKPTAFWRPAQLPAH